MRHALTAAVLCAAMLFIAACTGSEEPSSPPTPEAALTTDEATSTPDEVETTTVEPSTDETTATSLADGPPELPALAREQTEAGAEAFVQYYVDVLNYGSQDPQSVDLATLNAADCGTCFLFTELLDTLRTQQLRTTGPVFEVLGFDTELGSETTLVAANLTQLGPPVVDSEGEVFEEAGIAEDVNFVFTLSYDGENWKLSLVS